MFFNVKLSLNLRVRGVEEFIEALSVSGSGSVSIVAGASRVVDVVGELVNGTVEDKGLSVMTVVNTLAGGGDGVSSAGSLGCSAGEVFLRTIGCWLSAKYTRRCDGWLGLVSR